VKDKRRPASPQAIIYMSATKAVERAAAALDLASRDALAHINELVHCDRLAMFGRELRSDGPARVWQIKGEELRGTRLEINSDGHVRLLGVAGPGIVGVAWSKAQIVFRQVDIDQLWPPPVEQVPAPPSPTRRKSGGRKEEFDWDAILVEAVLRWDAMGRPDPKDFSLSQLADDLRKWCEGHLAGGEAPQLDTISRRLSKALTAWKLSSGPQTN
jgi:hypothetical protein